MCKWPAELMHLRQYKQKNVTPKREKQPVLTCLKCGRDVGGAFTVIRDSRDVNLVVFSTFELCDLTTGGV